MKKVTSEIEALQICREYGCEIVFKKSFYNVPEHVIVKLNAWTKVIGKDLIEAVNRLSDMYHTAPVDYEKLDWWEDNINFYRNY